MRDENTIGRLLGNVGIEMRKVHNGKLVVVTLVVDLGNILLLFGSDSQIQKMGRSGAHGGLVQSQLWRVEPVFVLGENDATAKSVQIIDVTLNISNLRASKRLTFISSLRYRYLCA